MTPTTKQVQEWEKELGFIMIDLGDYTPESEITKEEFLSHMEKNNLHGVSYEDRVAFLKRNDYPVTRENMIAELSAKPPKKKKEETK